MQAVLQRTTFVVLLAVIGTLSACSNQRGPEVTPPSPDATAQTRPEQARPDTESPPADEWQQAPIGGDVIPPWELAEGALETVYFDYDQSEIRPDQRVKLQTNAQFLREHTRLRILIAGHCDERGTREYNMALGERRASSAMQYLAALGIPRERIEIISYGEEQPVVAGSTESSWAQNRRAEFRAIEGGEG